MIAEPGAAATARPAGAAEWSRLAAGMLLVEPLRELIRFVPLLIALVFAGRAGESGPPWGLIGTAAVIALGISRYLTTRYRITPLMIEVRRGLLSRKTLTVPRDRVRTVDISAHPLQRMLGLVKVQIGTGTSHSRSEAVALDGLRASVATPLRAELLHRARAGHPAGRPAGSRPPSAARSEEALGPDAQTPTRPGPPIDPGPPADPGAFTDPIPSPDPPGDETEIARLRLRWVWYAPATLSGAVTGLAIIGLAWRVLNEAQLNPADIGVVNQGWQHLESTPIWLDVLQVGVLVLLVVTALSMAGYLIAFWGFRLTRHSGGSLHVSRGLLTTRATSIEERRVRGTQRSEPLLLRLVGGARVSAIATGLRAGRGSGRGGEVLLPPAPLQTAIDVETVVLGSPEPGLATLLPRGPAARRRRYNRALGVTGAVVAGLAAWWWSGPLPAWIMVMSLFALPLAALLARDRYRNLGHAVVDGVLVTRLGSLVRRRSVLDANGIVGVTFRRSWFQRRNDLTTLIATTAAGQQKYAVPDLTDAVALALAREVLPVSGEFVNGLDGVDRARQAKDARALVGGDQPAGHSSGAMLRPDPSVTRLRA